MNDPYSQSGQDTGALGRLIAALRRLPGVGPKSAKRMAYHLMERDRPGAKEIAEALVQAAERIHHCERCRNLTEEKLCHICASPRRDPAKLCIVETPTDLHSIEEAGIYNGRYFVLMGHLSPLDGIGPDELGMDQLQGLLEQGDIEEVVLATNLTVEGEATAHFISEMVHSRKIDVTRIAHGVPVGGELEYIDSSTLSQAFTGRRKI